MKASILFTGLMLGATTAMAQVTVPNAGDTYGNLNYTSSLTVYSAQETFSGVTIGLGAHERYVAGNPMSATVTNNGAGVYTAFAGTNPAGGAANATWNFDYYIAGAAIDLGKFVFKLNYDFNPAVGNTLADHGTVTFPGALVAANVAPGVDSWNLGFGFLTTGAAGVIPPTFGSFDPNAQGQYSFLLTAYNSPDGINVGTEAFSTAILVNAVPEPGEWAMMLAGLGAVGLIARRRQSQKA